MKKKPKVEADLDPQNARNTRFGSKIVETALKNSAPPAKPKRPAAAKRKRSR